MFGSPWISLVLAVGLSPTADAEPPVAARRHGGYVHVSPGLVGIVPVADAGLTTWSFGLDLGWHFRGGRRFTGQLGVLVDDAMVIADPRAHQILAGSQLRLGATVAERPGVFVYGAGTIGPTLSLMGGAPWIGLGAILGPGVQIVLARRLSLGFEPGLALGGEAWVQLRARLFVGVRF